MATPRNVIKRTPRSLSSIENRKIYNSTRLNDGVCDEAGSDLSDTEGNQDEPDCRFDDRLSAIHDEDLDRDSLHNYSVTKRTACERIMTKKSPVKKSTTHQHEIERRSRYRGGLTPVFYIGLVLIIIIVIVCIGPSLKKYTTAPSYENEDSLVTIFEDIKYRLKILYEQMEQTKHFWTQVLSQVTLLTEAYPPHPAVLLVLVPSDSQKTAACLSQLLLNEISAAFGDTKFVSFDTVSHSWSDAAALKHDLDRTLQGLSDSHAAAVYNVEKLDPEAAMIFHAYCDNENAPHKRAFFLLTLGVKLSYSSYAPLALPRLDHVVYNQLINLWTQALREDDAAAIIARVANAPVVVKPERSDVISHLCPY